MQIKKINIAIIDKQKINCFVYTVEYRFCYKTNILTS